MAQRLENPRLVPHPSEVEEEALGAFSGAHGQVVGQEHADLSADDEWGEFVADGVEVFQGLGEFAVRYKVLTLDLVPAIARRSLGHVMDNLPLPRACSGCDTVDRGGVETLVFSRGGDVFRTEEGFFLRGSFGAHLEFLADGDHVHVPVLPQGEEAQIFLAVYDLVEVLKEGVPWQVGVNRFHHIEVFDDPHGHGGDDAESAEREDVVLEAGGVLRA